MNNEISLLHVIDDEKFISSCERTFSLPNIQNNFCPARLFEKYIKNNEFDIIFLHYLKEESVKVLNEQKIEQPVVWFFWGADAFCLGQFYNQFVLSKTKMIRLKLSFKKGIVNGVITIIKTFFPLLIDKSFNYKDLIKSFDKISIVVPIVPGDFNLLCKNYSLKSSSFHLNYITPVFDYNISISLNRNNILLGNSASYSNNHIEIIDMLSRMKLGERKVIIPLSYGDKSYGSFIKQYAEKKLTNSLCLLEFLQFDEYQKILESCSIVIMNHLRQQGLGNVLQALMIGSHIYMQPSSTLYQYLRENLFYISSVTHLKDLKTLSKSEQDHNKKRCREVFGEQTQHKKVRQLIEKALS